MPDILIREFEMPETCGQCPIFNFDYNICNILSTHHHEYETSRIYGCPLHELPTHGDLIDRDEYLESLEKSVDACRKWIAEMKAAEDERMVDIAIQTHSTFIEVILRAKSAQVVIPSNKEETE